MTRSIAAQCSGWGSTGVSGERIVKLSNIYTSIGWMLTYKIQMINTGWQTFCWNLSITESRCHTIDRIKGNIIANPCKYRTKNKIGCHIFACIHFPLRWRGRSDTWHVTHDTWHMTHSVGWTFSQNFSFLALPVWEWQCFEYISTNHQLLSYSITQLITKLFVEQPRLHRVC